MNFSVCNPAVASGRNMDICPVCGQQYHGYPAVSRQDGKTEICPECGMREAFAAYGLDHEAIEKLVDEIHSIETH